MFHFLYCTPGEPITFIFRGYFTHISGVENLQFFHGFGVQGQFQVWECGHSKKASKTCCFLRTSCAYGDRPGGSRGLKFWRVRYSSMFGVFTVAPTHYGVHHKNLVKNMWLFGFYSDEQTHMYVSNTSQLWFRHGYGKACQLSDGVTHFRTELVTWENRAPKDWQVLHCPLVM